MLTISPGETVPERKGCGISGGEAGAVKHAGGVGPATEKSMRAAKASLATGGVSGLRHARRSEEDLRRRVAGEIDSSGGVERQGVRVVVAKPGHAARMNQLRASGIKRGDERSAGLAAGRNAGAGAWKIRERFGCPGEVDVARQSSVSA